MEEKPFFKKIKIKKETQSSPKSKEKSPKKINTVQRSIPEGFPKNVNDYRHLIDDIKSGKADVEFMLELRRPRKIENIEKSNGNEPSFYQNDLTKYKNKNALKPEEKKVLQTNLGKFKYILSDRTKYAINNPTFKYEVRLRTEPPYISRSIDKKIENKNNLTLNVRKWDPSNMPKHSSLLNTLLPPILPQSKEVFSKNEKRVGRPIIIKRNDGYINGVKIKSRIFDYNSLIALRYPSDHLPNSRYSNDYGVGNLGEISHLIKSDNRTMTNNWCSYLRGIKKRSLSPIEIRKTEQKLRDKSNERSNLKI